MLFTASSATRQQRFLGSVDAYFISAIQVYGMSKDAHVGAPWDTAKLLYKNKRDDKPALAIKGGLETSGNDIFTAHFFLPPRKFPQSFHAMKTGKQ